MVDHAFPVNRGLLLGCAVLPDTLVSGRQHRNEESGVTIQLATRDTEPSFELSDPSLSALQAGCTPLYETPWLPILRHRFKNETYTPPIPPCNPLLPPPSTSCC